MIFENIEMRKKAVLRTLEEKVAPHHTALLIIDMQNDYASSIFSKRRGKQAYWSSTSSLQPYRMD
jgi:hypothetical protein